MRIIDSLGSLAIAGGTIITFVVWLARLESKVKDHDKRVAKIEGNDNTQLLSSINRKIDNLITNLKWIIKTSGANVPDNIFDVEDSEIKK